ncbi:MULTISPECIES: hypothetical protein [Leeuwenhoekiella]|uniref:hypothetical protein n=1 Tax=Leeuwenhoekiella TaxID=283735 RepID=UPI000C5E1AA5|nr:MULTISPECIES: hypothetical protein [Leeuwenhoekiella]MAO42136.1 hypothetical protein [Leeuwenhoekiella sp.]|tara:strand:- start:58 stop:411 length:354 start_codon:yes stop_codon:yes gene_type:complete
MRRMSFALTKEQVKNQSKNVTRRQGWANLKPGDLVQPVEKCMGLKKGEKQKLIGGPIRILSNRPEPVDAIRISKNECVREGFPDWTAREFIALYCATNKIKPGDTCNRIHFEYVNPL